MSLYSFNREGEMIAKSYEITTLQGETVDAATRSFDYRFEYGMLRNWSSFALANRIQLTVREK